MSNPEIINEGEEKAYSDSGVDLTLIDWMLSLTPTERLVALQNNINTIMRLTRFTKLGE